MQRNDAIVILDYTLFDFADASELINLSDRFRNAHWILLSEELSVEFLKRVIYSSENFSIIFKDCSYHELILALEQASCGERFICSKAFNILTSKSASEPPIEENKLTATEREVLQMIASGKTTKEIAAERNLSFHTINAHRKNIFRKLEVNNIHEATKYAIRGRNNRCLRLLHLNRLLMKSRLFIISIFLFSLFANTPCLYADDAKTDTTTAHSFQASVTTGNNQINMGKKQEANIFYLKPAFHYSYKEGFFADLSSTYFPTLNKSGIDNFCHRHRL